MLPDRRTAVAALLLVVLSGCTRPAAPALAGPADAGAPESPADPSVSRSRPVLPGCKVAFVRRGNVIVLDLGTGAETALTHDGHTDPADGVSYVAPTFVSGSRVALLKWQGSPYTESSTQTVVSTDLDRPALRAVRAPSGAISLGVVPSTGELLVQHRIPKPGGRARGSDYVPWVRLAVVAKGGRVRETSLIDRCPDITPESTRIRASAELGILALPRFPTDFSSTYSLFAWPGCTRLSGLDPDPRLGDYFMGVFGMDVTATGIYGTSGYALLALSTSTPEQRREVAALHEIPLGVAVSLRCRCAVLSTQGEGGDDGESGTPTLGNAAGATEGRLWLVELDTGAVYDLCDGGSPDIWPR